MTYARRFRDGTNYLWFWCAIGCLFSAPCWPEDASPAETVGALHAGLLTAADRRQQPWAERYTALLPLIVASHDLEYIGRFTLRRQWVDLTEEQREGFQAAFEKLAVANYVARFGDLNGARFEVVGEEPLPAGRRQVSAMLKPPAAEPVTLNYVLHDRDGWRIINVVANDVSDLALKRAEYQRLFRAEGLPGLVERLRQQAAELEN